MARRKAQTAMPPKRVESIPARTSEFATDETRFTEVLELIEAARRRAYQSVNSELVGLYWSLGEYISKKIAATEWGGGVVDELAAAIARKYPGMRGYTRPNLFRMRQFYEAYRGNEKVSALLRQLPWTHHLTILSHTKRLEERLFYVAAAAKSGWSSRELERQLRSFAFRRGNIEAARVYPVQVGNQDFAIDLVFFHRGLSCLVAFELKVRRFEPEDLGKLSFYVEALDRDVKKAHERPSIGVLLCATKDDEVVEYALARSSSPTLVAEYQTMLPPKAVLRRKLHELYTELASDAST